MISRRQPLLITVLVMMIVTMTSSFTITTQSVRQMQQKKSLVFATTTSAAATTTTSNDNDKSSIAAVSITDDVSGNYKPKNCDVVTIECQLVPDFEISDNELLLMDGIVVAEPGSTTTMTTLKFVVGMGNYLQSLHELVQTMSVGESIVNQSVDAGYGQRDSRAIATLQFVDTPGIPKDKIKIGTIVQVSTGQNLQFRVTDITDETYTIDGNHPFAGRSYQATITLLSIESGPERPLPFCDTESSTTKASTGSRYEVATFALGCFWGGELEYMRVPGVVGTAVGYTQGTVADPAYEQVCSGTTGHTEAIVVYYDPTIVPYERLIEIAFNRLGSNKLLINQVGNDRGTQYRHGIHYHTPEQELVAKRLVQEIGGPNCVTECLPAKEFYFAEDYHQQYLYKGGQSARKNDSTTIRCYG